VTNPVDINAIIPSKAKTWVSLVGTLLTFIGPFILSSTDALPAPWPAVIGAVFAVLTVLGVYKAPYKPTGTILAVDPSAPVVSDKVPENAPTARPTYVGPDTPGGPVRNPWKGRQ